MNVSESKGFVTIQVKVLDIYVHQDPLASKPDDESLDLV